MPATLQSVTITRPDAATIKIAIGSDTITLPISEILAIWDGERDYRHLLWDFFKVLQAAGVNPRTATASQVKNAIEAQTYAWGN